MYTKQVQYNCFDYNIFFLCIKDYRSLQFNEWMSESCFNKLNVRILYTNEFTIISYIMDIILVYKTFFRILCIIHVFKR